MLMGRTFVPQLKCHLAVKPLRHPMCHTVDLSVRSVLLSGKISQGHCSSQTTPFC